MFSFLLRLRALVLDLALLLVKGKKLMTVLDDAITALQAAQAANAAAAQAAEVLIAGIPGLVQAAVAAALAGAGAPSQAQLDTLNAVATDVTGTAQALQASVTAQAPAAAAT